MSTSTTNFMKRKRNGGDNMPTIRERVDEDTGRIIKVQIDTTKEAKKRRKTATAQWVPTAGEINAADIWNKQEEKIKRDKEREERKKKTAARQAEKDAKAKELQEELLRKGKISVEDTWGKVSASQNRLSKFFGPPSVFRQPAKQPLQSVKDNGVRESLPSNSEGDVATDDHLDCSHINHDNADTDTGSHHIQKDPAQTRDGHCNKLTSGEKGNHLMLPPSGPLQRPSPRRGQSLVARDSVPSAMESDKIIRKPLSPMTASQINIRSNDRLVFNSPQKNTGTFPLSTQVVMETLDGISSQDLIDDWDTEMTDDKENLFQTESSRSNMIDGFREADQTTHLSRNIDTVDNAFEFGDDRIDDETLMYFAATQRINDNVQRSSGNNIPLRSPKLTRRSSNEVYEDISCSNPVHSPDDTMKQQAAGDSFAFTDVDDEDLLRCLDEFEDDTNGIYDEDLLEAVAKFEATSGPDENGLKQKKRRVLPWVKNPVQYSSQEAVEEPWSATQSFGDW